MTAVRLDQFDGASIINFAAEQTDKSVQSIFFNLAAITPKCFHNCTARDDATMIADQQLQQAKFSE
jgi:hypothetical protein